MRKQCFSFIYSGANVTKLNKSVITNPKLDSYYNHLSDFIKISEIMTVKSPGSPRDLSFSDNKYFNSTRKSHYRNPIFFSAGKSSCTWQEFFDRL